MACAQKIIKAILDVKDVVVQGMRGVFNDLEELTSITVPVRLRRNTKYRCPHCGRVCPVYDWGRGEKHRWRTVDWGGIPVYMECDLPRVKCPEHNVVTAGVPWAYHKSRFTKSFENLVTFYVTSMPKSMISLLFNIDWKTIGRFIHRVLNDLEPDRKIRFLNLRNIGIDETSYKKGRKFIIVVVDHDTNRVVWIHKGHDYQTLKLFFNELTEEQRANIKMVSGDAAPYIWKAVKEFVPNAIRCIDHFHVAQLGTSAVDQVRRDVVREYNDRAKEIELQISEADTEEEKDDLRRQLKAEKDLASEIKKSKFALLKGRERLSEKQAATLEMVVARSNEIARAHKFKELLRAILKRKDGNLVAKDLKDWIVSAAHSNLKPIKKLAKTIKKLAPEIINTITYGVSNARVEATNAQIKLLIRMAKGFRRSSHMFDLIFLKCSDLRPPLPHRKPPKPKAA